MCAAGSVSAAGDGYIVAVADTRRDHCTVVAGVRGLHITDSQSAPIGGSQSVREVAGGTEDGVVDDNGATVRSEDGVGVVGGGADGSRVTIPIVIDGDDGAVTRNGVGSVCQNSGVSTEAAGVGLRGACRTGGDEGLSHSYVGIRIP